MILRTALPKDVSRLSLLEKEIFQEENFPLSYASFAYHIKNNLLIVAETDGKIAGYILALIKRKKAKIYSIGVALAYRGEKVSLKLFQKVLLRLKALGFTQIVLEVRVDNFRAIELYKKFDFEVIKKIKSFYRDGCDALIMEREDADQTL